MRGAPIFYFDDCIVINKRKRLYERDDVLIPQSTEAIMRRSKVEFNGADATNPNELVLRYNYQFLPALEMPYASFWRVCSAARAVSQCCEVLRRGAVIDDGLGTPRGSQDTIFSMFRVLPIFLYVAWDPSGREIMIGASAYCSPELASTAKRVRESRLSPRTRRADTLSGHDKATPTRNGPAPTPSPRPTTHTTGDENSHYPF